MTSAADQSRTSKPEPTIKDYLSAILDECGDGLAFASFLGLLIGAMCMLPGLINPGLNAFFLIGVAGLVVGIPIMFVLALAVWEKISDGGRAVKKKAQRIANNRNES